MASTATKKTAERPAGEKGKAPCVKLPASLGACADLYAELKDQRLEENKEVKKLEEKEKFVKKFLIETLSKDKGQDRGAVGKHHRVQVEVEMEPQVEDWDKFYAHLKKTGDFSLLNRALNSTAVEERWANKKVIPGVTSVPVVKLRCHKL